jgi:hypothetical protein
MKNPITYTIKKIKKLFRDPLKGVIEWEHLSDGRLVLTEQTYIRAAKLGYSREQIEMEAMDRRGWIW